MGWGEDMEKDGTMPAEEGRQVQPSSSEMFVQKSPSITSQFLVVLISFFLGSGVVFAVLCRCRAMVAAEKPLLQA
jgi:hypothetical protein